MIRAHLADFGARVGLSTGPARLAAVRRLGEELETLGAPPAQILESILSHNRTHCTPPLALDDARAARAGAALVGKTYAQAEQWLLLPPVNDSPEPTGRSPFQVVKASEFSIHNLPDFMVAGAIVKGSVHAFYGPTQVGKTFAALDFALCVATGRPWHGRIVAQSAVLWVAAEDPTGVQLRALAWLKHHAVDAALVPFRTIQGNLFNLRSPTTVDAITAAARELLIDAKLAHALIVVDTLVRATPGMDEISGRDTGEVVAAFDKLRYSFPSTICIIHHSGKNEEAGLRGHSSLGQGIDSYAAVKKSGAGSTVEFEKVKNAKLPLPIGFGLKVVVLGELPNGDLVDSCVVLPRTLMPVEVSEVPLTAVSEQYISALATAIRDDGVELPDALTGGRGVRGAPMEEWRKCVKAQVQEGLAASAARMAWKRARDSLVTLGHVRTCAVDKTEYAFLVA